MSPKVRSRASADDRVAAMMAAEDAVIAAVADPFVSDDVRDALTTPFERLRPPDERSASLPSRRCGTRPSPVVDLIAVGVLAFGALRPPWPWVRPGLGLGLAGLGAAVAIVLVALVVRGRPDARDART